MVVELQLGAIMGELLFRGLVLLLKTRGRHLGARVRGARFNVDMGVGERLGRGQSLSVPSSVVCWVCPSSTRCR